MKSTDLRDLNDKLQNAKEAARILTLFKRMLPKNLAALEV